MQEIMIQEIKDAVQEYYGLNTNDLEHIFYEIENVPYIEEYPSIWEGFIDAEKKRLYPTMDSPNRRKNKRMGRREKS